MSVPGISSWLNVLEATAQIFLVPPFFENLGKRLIKAPKLYVADSGLACHLLGIETAAELERSPFLGALFEGFVASEIIKAQLHAGKRRELYTFRDQQGLEVDFMVPGKAGSITLIEAKAARTVRPEMAKSLRRLGDAWHATHPKGAAPKQLLVHRPARHAVASTALAPGVCALPVEEFVAGL